MSIIDKALGAVTPPESDEKRAEATRKAREAAGSDDWLSLALDHHDRIRAAFEACLSASGADDRMTAMKRLALVLNGHSQDEEVVLYPAMAKAGEKGSAGLAYTEQVESGLLHVNCPTTVSELQMPYGGLKESGHGGREMGRYGLEFFSEVQAVYLRP